MSDTNEREEFEKWWEVTALPLPITACCGDYETLKERDYINWQARGELEAKKLEAFNARYQARVRELEDSIRWFTESADLGKVSINFLLKHFIRALSTTPDTALQRKVLEARIETAVLCSKQQDPNCRKLIQELRAQLAALNSNETLGE